MLLRHRPVAAPHPGLDVGERDARLLRRPRAGKSGRGVAVDEHPVGLLLLDRVDQSGPHALEHFLLRQAADSEAVARVREAELLEEDL